VGGENVGNGLGHAKLRVEVDRRPGAPSFRCLTLLAIAQEKMRARIPQEGVYRRLGVALSGPAEQHGAVRSRP
jgi:hypothetical protein